MHVRKGNKINRIHKHLTSNTRPLVPEILNKERSTYTVPRSEIRTGKEWQASATRSMRYFFASPGCRTWAWSSFSILLDLDLLPGWGEDLREGGGRGWGKEEEGGADDGRKQGPRGAIRCNYFVVNYCSIVIYIIWELFIVKIHDFRLSKITWDGPTDRRTYRRTDGHDLL